MRLRTWTVVVLVCLASVACGPAPQSESQRIDPSTVPFGLLERRIDDQRPSGNHSLVLYFVASDRLVAVDHQEAGKADGAIALRRLLDGPTELELRQGLGTSLPSAHAARFLDSSTGVARVNLAEDFHDGTIPNQVTALAQIVLTLTDVTGIDRVSFLVDEHTEAVPRGDGSLTARPVGREDYSTFLRPPPP